MPGWDREQPEAMTQGDYDQPPASEVPGFTKGGRPRPCQLISAIKPETTEHLIIALVAGYAAEIRHDPAREATAKSGSRQRF